MIFKACRAWTLGLMVLLTAWAAAGVPRAAAEDASLAAGRLVAGEMTDGKFPAVVERMTPDMAKELPVEKLAAVWQSVLASSGAVKRIGTATMETKGGYDVVTVPIEFAKATLDLRVSFAGGRIGGLYILPHEAPRGPWTSAAYVDAAGFREVEVTIGSAPGALPATLSLPVKAGPLPVVILVHGSGPNDRDESIGANKPFRDLAEGLASRGIAVLRYEKRTKVFPAAFQALATPTVKDETLDDVDAAVALLAGRAEIDPARIVVLGHSLGGMLAPRIARDNPRVRALVILAGATRPLPTLIVEQVSYLSALRGALSDTEAKRITALKLDAEKALAARPGATGAAILGVPPSYWGDLNAYDPAETAGKLTVPMLILQGERDYQVTLADLARFRSALDGHANAEIHVLPGLDHLFVAGTGKSTPADYGKPGHVDRTVIELIAGFVGRL